MKHWEIRGSMPPAIPQGHSYAFRENVTSHVIAASARRALELVEAKHKGIEIYSAQHRGKIDVIDDRDSVEA